MKIPYQPKYFAIQIAFGIIVMTLFILYNYSLDVGFIHEDAKISTMHPLPLPEVLPRIPNSSIDFERINNVLWPSDPECKRYSVHFGRNMSAAFLASFPRSGNTWTRYLIEAVSGIFTGTIYLGESNTLALDFFGSKEKPSNKTTIIVKTHIFNAISKTKTATEVPVVLLIRNPEKSLISFWNYRGAKRKIKFFFDVPSSSYDTPEFHSFAASHVESWTQIAMSCIKNVKKLLVIFYENILKDPIKEVKKIMHFLGYEADPGRLQCLRKYPEGKARRKHKEVDPYTPQEKLRFALNMARILISLKERGIEIPQEYSDYVKNISSI